MRYNKKLKSLIKCFTILLTGLILFSCAGNQAVRPESSFNTEPHVSQENKSEVITHTPSHVSENNPVLPLQTPIESAYTGDYVLGPEDLIEIDVYQVGELKRTERVSASGFIKLPLTGLIKVAGLTASELEAEIGKSLERYLQDPVVSVYIKEYRSQSITVLGALKEPQVYTVTRQKFLVDIISMAGGLTKDAGDICYVRRGGETVIINIKDLLIGGDMRLNIPVFSGDVVHVPVGGVIFVDGSVNSPGSFSMQGTLTLTQAIAMSKGFKYEAIKDQLRIYRDSGQSVREIIDVDYDSILAEKSPDIVLKDKDIVIVPRSGAKALWNGFVQSLSGAIRLGSVSLGGGF